MLSVVKLLLKRVVGDYSLNCHGNYIVDYGKSWTNHGIVFLNFCGNPAFTSHKHLWTPLKYKIFENIMKNGTFAPEEQMFHFP